MKQVIVGENREAGAQKNKGREPDKGVRRERQGDGSSKMAGSRRNYLAILNFCGIKKRSKGRTPQKWVKAGKAKLDGTWDIWTPANNPPPPPPHTHTHTMM